jgi:hypothetical protein
MLLDDELKDVPCADQNAAPLNARLAPGLASLGVAPVGKGADKAERFFDEEFVRCKRVIDTAGIKIGP